MLPRRLLFDFVGLHSKLFFVWLSSVALVAVAEFFRIVMLFVIFSAIGLMSVSDQAMPGLKSINSLDDNPKLALVIFFGVSTIYFVLSILSSHLFANNMQSYVQNKRRTLLLSFLSSPWSVSSRSQASDLISAITSESERLMRLIAAFLSFLSNLITTVLLVGLGAWAAPKAFAAILLCAPIVLVGVILSRRGGLISKRVLSGNVALAENINFILSQLKSIKGMSLEGRFFELINDKIVESKVENQKSVFFSHLPTHVSDFMGVIFLSTVLMMGLMGLTEVSSLVLLLTVFIRVYPKINSTLTFYQSMVAHSSAMDFFDQVRTKLGGDNALPVHKRDLQGDVRIDLQSVDVELDSRPVLKGVSLSILPGERVAIVGDSGSGKTTLVDAMLGLVGIKSGKILINGNVATEDGFTQLRNKVAYIDQASSLANMSIGENLMLFNPHIDKVTIQSLMAKVGLADLVSRPEDKVIGLRGEGVSGGQRQRICLVRALALPHSLIVLDEVTSSLDETSTRVVLDLLLGDRTKTIIFITHDHDIIRTFDRVLEVRDGLVFERKSKSAV